MATLAALGVADHDVCPLLGIAPPARHLPRTGLPLERDLEHAAGLPREAALAAASWAAREWLGLPGIEEGAPADLVVYGTDPRADLDALARPRRMVLRGVVVG